MDVFALRHGRPPSLRRTTSRPGDPRRCRCRGSLHIRAGQARSARARLVPQIAL
ncbi:UNVERIFIED_ORG: hypothetical protein QOE_2313, partial [Clostridioides difficile F501]